MTRQRPIPIDLQTIAEFHWRIENAGIRQANLLTPSRLATLARQCNIAPGLQSHIIDLWRVGCLRADLVVADAASPAGFCLLDDGGEERQVYGDVRGAELYVADSGISFLKPQFDASGMEPHFHPFRLFVLYELHRTSMFGISGLLPECRISEDDDEKSSWFRGWLGEAETAARILRINQISGLAAISDPCGLPDARDATRSSLDFDELRRRIDSYRPGLHDLYRLAGRDALREAHEELCVAAERQNPDKTIGNVVRLMANFNRQQLKGPVAGAYRMHEQAETIRRVAETAFDTKLQEEDESGFGTVFPSYKIETFGADRLRDGDMKVKGAFLRSVGLDYRHCANLYVEGATEAAAMETLFASPGIVAVKDLAGQIVEKGGKGLAFRQSLEGDLETNTFSFVLLDGDVPNNVRVVKAAARDDKLCGAFLISTPDFELGNFTYEEMAALAADLLADSANPPSADQILDAIQGTGSAKEIEKKFASFGDLRKGPRWGEALINYAWNNPDWTPAGAQEPMMRPIMEFVGWLQMAPSASFFTTRKGIRVNPDTGRPERRT